VGMKFFAHILLFASKICEVGLILNDTEKAVRKYSRIFFKRDELNTSKEGYVHMH
jgi:hypothetical protein